MDAMNEEVQAKIEKEDGKYDDPAWNVVDQEPDLITREQTVRAVVSVTNQAKSETSTEKREEPR